MLVKKIIKIKVCLYPIFNSSQNIKLSLEENEIEYNPVLHVGISFPLFQLPFFVYLRG